jgi:photosystem II stability/assembly factor-like uncharacterized protein
VARRIVVAVCLGAAVAGVAALLTAGSGRARSATAEVTTTVGPTRFLGSSFGYAVAYSRVERGDTSDTTIGLFVYDHRRWRNVTPPALHANGIDDVAFTDRRHGWVAAYNCGEVAVYLYRTSDGGRSWRSLGKPATHSCGGGPTFLSFVDPRHGWMEPVSPNGPGGELLRTNDGGATWSRVASLHQEKPGLPCLAPIAFTSRSTGWMGHSTVARHDSSGGLCAAHLYETKTAGQTWQAHAIQLPRTFGKPVIDTPRFFGHFGVVAATLGGKSARAVAFAASTNVGNTWSVRSLRPISSCSPRDAFWPASVANNGVWWIVAGRRQTFAHVTSDAGHHWHTVVAHGLPRRSCAVTRVSAADASLAWVVARYGRGLNTALFQTRDGGRTWHRATLLHK